ncbi:MAG: phosphotransferase [Pseudomonadota bacterium]
MLDVTRKAAGLWSMTSKPELVACRENTVFKVACEKGRFHALRLHRPGYRSDEEVASELDWMEGLQTAGLTVPRPIPSRNGRLLEHVDGLQADILTWVAGEPMGQSGQPLQLADRLGVFRRLGETMARLHSACDAWAPPAGFQRWAWDADGLVGEQPVWARFWENPHLNARQAELLVDARRRAAEDLAHVSGALDYGLIHADLVPANILVDGDRLILIDFDDGGFGFRLFDLATIAWANRHEDDIADLEQSLIAGYRQVRNIDPAWLPLFKLLRAFTYVGWIIPRMDEPGGRERCARFIEAAEDWARNYLETQDLSTAEGF